jgi:hypothetical protein
MWEDPIVAEVHRIRKEIAAKYNFDMAAYFADVQRRQVALRDRLVLHEKRAELDAAPDRGGSNGTSAPTSQQPPRPVI